MQSFLKPGHQRRVLQAFRHFAPEEGFTAVATREQLAANGASLSSLEGTLGVCELKRVELLRDVFVWAYERSCQRYLAVRDTVAEPDPLRLRYREKLIAIVGEIMRDRQAPSEDAVRAVAASLVAPEDMGTSSSCPSSACAICTKATSLVTAWLV